MAEVPVVARGDDKHPRDVERKHQRDPFPLEVDEIQADARSVNQEKWNCRDIPIPGRVGRRR